MMSSWVLTASKDRGSTNSLGNLLHLHNWCVGMCVCVCVCKEEKRFSCENTKSLFKQFAPAEKIQAPLRRVWLSPLAPAERSVPYRNKISKIISKMKNLRMSLKLPAGQSEEPPNQGLLSERRKRVQLFSSLWEETLSPLAQI